MATRSEIGMKVGDKIAVIYCHWDGSPSNNGDLLLNWYQDTGKIRQLISLGSLSSLGINPNQPPEWLTYNDMKHHDKRREYCISYLRDRILTNESDGSGWLIKDCQPKIVNADFTGDEEYFYYWDGEKWFFTSYANRTIRELTHEDTKDRDDLTSQY